MKPPGSSPSYAAPGSRTVWLGPTSVKLSHRPSHDEPGALASSTTCSTPRQRQLVARGQPGLPGPDDDDVDLLDHASTVAPGRGPVSRMPRYAVAPGREGSPRPAAGRPLWRYAVAPGREGHLDPRGPRCQARPRARPTASSSDHASWNRPVPARTGMRPRPVARRRRPPASAARRAGRRGRASSAQRRGERGEPGHDEGHRDERDVEGRGSRDSPIRTASVRLPCSRSVGMSRRLLATRIAEARAPDADRAAPARRRRRRHRRHRAEGRDEAEEDEDEDLAEPEVAVGARARRCSTRRRATAAAPIGIMIHRPERATSARPMRPAKKKHAKAANLTLTGSARRWPTSRTGPTRTSSVPRMPSE